MELRFPPGRPPRIEGPGVWNLTGDRRFQEAWPLSWNYLRPESPNYAFKRLQRQIYLDRFGPWLETLPAGAPVIDIGGGIGRFGCAWLERGLAVAHTDPNAEALALALGHLAGIGGRFGLWHLSAEDLSPLADEAFFAASAIEVFCYLSEPARGFAEAARVLRPGGLLFVSVESPLGALEPGVPATPAAIDAALGATRRSLEDDLFVLYFTRESLRAALEAAGLVVETVFGVCYVPDGPLHHLIDFDRLCEPRYQAALVELERLLASSSRHGGHARAFGAVARKP